MQLTKIKIAGFKSFVDPTVIALPSNLIAVVGPNGCGKSNIIDAVTWVMGESSPKYLRGEASTDVIFNGSHGRKPVGQASVELIFDNADGSIGGEYAGYAEISIKRMISRKRDTDNQADSSYYLNGVRCRKRDVLDIFLGTGLGPRSYSIIGQNMITRIIEAKPDDLRTYIEEAAGISKYKERRRETELHIGHTKDNLARVNDVRTELEKQLSHLQHQAAVAEKYTNLKEQERSLRAELYGAEWRELDCKLVDGSLKIQREETALEARQTDLGTTDRDLDNLRNEQRVSQDIFQEVQRRYYAAANEITRIEQDITHQQERQAQRESDLQQAGHDWQSISEQLEEADDALIERKEEIETITPQFALCREEVDTLQNALADVEEGMQTWQTRWDEFNQSSAKATQTAQVEQTRMSQIEQRSQALQKRQLQLQQDQAKFDFTTLDQELAVCSQQVEEAEENVGLQAEQLETSRQQMQTVQSTLQNANNALNLLRSELQRVLGEQASLEALQQTALGQRDHSIASWLSKHHLDNKTRLAQHIEVEAGWEYALEKVLGQSLQAVCADNITDVVEKLGDFTNGNLCAFSATHSQGENNQKQIGTLLKEKVKAPWPLDAFIAGVYIAETLDEAQKLCTMLAVNESVITKEGVWLNPSWIKVLKEEDASAGVLQREQALKSLTARIDVLQEEQATKEEMIVQLQKTLSDKESERDQLQQLYHQQQAQFAQLKAQHKMKGERLSDLKAQFERFQTEQSECVSSLEEARLEYDKAKKAWQEALDSSHHYTEMRETLIAERDEMRLNLQQTRANANEKKQEAHELEIRLQTAKSQCHSLEQTSVRLQTQLSALSERRTSLQNELEGMAPIDSLKASLESALEAHITIESELNQARHSLETLNHDFQRLEQQRQSIEKDMFGVRNQLENLRIEWQGWKVKSDDICERIQESDFDLGEILKQLPEKVDIKEGQQKLDQIVQRISRLGAINLVAIDEYATCLERKEYLDKQLEDLNAGLLTLEDAIAKIDKETRTRFKETFDEVNARFQELFPTIFGGGKAYLELNSEDLLEAGITMMACPPGKRNSTIYLLSGGEKSLTAIALIFSIFHLNPSPFCLLDEVDAALDDANVLRFTRLVKAMAGKTQFIFISHNKITIEMGEHLIGVTMHEPGVSRLVSVDIEKAISLASA